MPSAGHLEVAGVASEHNAARDSWLTRGVAGVWDRLSEPLVERVFGPLAEQNHTLGVVAVNATLTAPRIAEVPLARSFVEQVQYGHHWRARAILLAKGVLKFSDGLDGSVARATHTSTTFGAAFDPAVDIIGSASDVWAIKKLAKKADDGTVDRLMDVGAAIDASAVVVGGLANALAARYALRNGIELTNQEKPKSVALAKAKYAAKGVGNQLIMLGQTVRYPVAQRSLRAAGIGFNVTAAALGVASVVQYGSSAVSKIKKVRHSKSTV